jgi:hypothetical protein
MLPLLKKHSSSSEQLLSLPGHHRGKRTVILKRFELMRDAGPRTGKFIKHFPGFLLDVPSGVPNLEIALVAVRISSGLLQSLTTPLGCRQDCFPAIAHVGRCVGWRRWRTEKCVFVFGG